MFFLLAVMPKYRMNRTKESSTKRKLEIIWLVFLGTFLKSCHNRRYRPTLRKCRLQKSWKERNCKTYPKTNPIPMSTLVVICKESHKRIHRTMNLPDSNFNKAAYSANYSKETLPNKVSTSSWLALGL